MNDIFKALAELNDLDDDPVSIVRETYIRAPFGYPGGKEASLPHILPRLPYTEIYVEPFGGSGAVLLARNESKNEVFNDRHSGVTAFYRAIRDKDLLDQLLERCYLTAHSREEFIWCKETWQDCDDVVERAARWWYMVSCSFSNKGMAFGRSRLHPGQFGKKIKNNLQWFYPCHKRLMNVQIENQDVFQILSDFDSYNTVFYLDPPYLGIPKLYQHGFNRKQHEKLLEVIQGLKGFVAISGYDDPLYDDVDWDNKHTWSTVTSITTSDSEFRSDGHSVKNIVEECLWIKDFK